MACHAGKVNQAFLNIVLNAIQASEHEGLIEVRTRPDGEAAVVVEVEDHGGGIRPEHLPHIFEPFFTTKPVVPGRDWASRSATGSSETRAVRSRSRAWSAGAVSLNSDPPAASNSGRRHGAAPITMTESPGASPIVVPGLGTPYGGRRPAVRSAAPDRHYLVAE